MARKTGADSGDVISRFADSGEDAVRTLIAFPLRVLVGALDILDAQVHRAADTLREFERVVDLEGRAGSSEKHTPRSRQGSRTTSEARHRTPTAAQVESERVERSAGSNQEPPGSDAATGHSRA
jgi:hypothetical protein